MNYYTYQFGTEALLIAGGLTFAGTSVSLEFQNLVFRTMDPVGGISPEIALVLTFILLLFVFNSSSNAYEFEKREENSSGVKEPTQQTGNDDLEKEKAQ